MMGSKKDINKKTDNIKLENCPRGGDNCMDLLKKVNSYLDSAHQYRLNKDYLQVLEFKHRAFKETIILESEHCFPCGHFFREHILQSVNENISELEEMANGFFKKQKLDELRKLAQEYQTFMISYMRNKIE